MIAIFERTKNIAVIGMSKNPEKSAYSIPAWTTKRAKPIKQERSDLES